LAFEIAAPLKHCPLDRVDEKRGRFAASFPTDCLEGLMNKIALIAGMVSLVAMSAAAQSPTAASKVGRDAGDAASGPVGETSAATLGSVNASAFVENAARSDMFEVRAGKLALTRSHDPAVRRFASEMIKAHTETTRALKAHLPPGLTPPTELDKRRQGMLDDLKASKPSEFDKRYIDQQVSAHQEALTLMKGYAAHGDKPELKAAAAKTVPVVEHHLDMAKSLAASHGG
jgi:putative membrane protein